MSIRAKFIALSIVLVTTLSIFITNNLVHAQNESVVIHRYEAPPMDAVNLYWIETEDGIVIVDTGRLLSQAKYALEEIQAVNKPLLGILITHHHTDHIGGLPAFVEAFGNVPIYASQFVRNDIETDESGFLARRKKLHGNDFPARENIPLPDRIIADRDKIELASLTFEVVEFKNNESPISTIYYLPDQKALFVGDFVTNERIPFLRNQHSENWIAQLQIFLERYPNLTVYSGHGKPNSTQQLIEAQIEYLKAARSLVASALANDSEVTPDEKAGIIAQMKQRYPNHQTSFIGRNGINGFLEGNVDAVAEELKGES